VKRFYKQAAVLSDADGFGVALDGRPIRTPGGQRLLLPVEALAAAIAQEWQEQPAERDIRPNEMRLMRLAATGIDRVPPQRAKVIDDTVKYAGTDLLCYRADGPDDLVVRQHRVWQPVLDWAAERYGVSLLVQTGVLHRPQPEDALRRYRDEVARHSNLGLCALFNLTAACGSLLLALAIAEGRLDAQAGYEAAEVDSLYQAERWGEDHEAAQRRAGIRADIAAAAKFLALLGSQRFTA
jgi:chaperone required for assembly of F1-ATPase